MTDAGTRFSEPQVDHSYTELPKAQHTIAVEYLPGQYDQRADSCAQCIQLVSQQQRPLVRTARIYLLSGPLSPEDLLAIRNYLINPIESREASLAPFTTLKERYETPDDVAVLSGFRDMEDKDLPDFLSRYGLAMDQADLAFCRDYFRSEGRDPSLTEIRMIDTYWSDHCRHTTFLTQIDSVSIHDSRVEGISILPGYAPGTRQTGQTYHPDGNSHRRRKISEAYRSLDQPGRVR